MTEQKAYQRIEQLMNECIVHGEYIEKIRELIDENVERNYELKENFKFHDEIDSYFYIVRYSNGDYNLFYKGKEAYDRFKREESAIRIERKTKNLFPTYETLIERE